MRLSFTILKNLSAPQALPSASLHENAAQDQEAVQAQDRNDMMDKSMALSLANIRGSLIRQEDTIIFSLIERSQFSLNAPVYDEGKLSQVHNLAILPFTTEQSHLRAMLYFLSSYGQHVDSCILKDLYCSRPSGSACFAIVR